jgi:hypothetical protein
MNAANTRQALEVALFHVQQWESCVSRSMRPARACDRCNQALYQHRSIYRGL